MPIICFRSLIDMAIGTPEVGNVNFNALHCLLHVMADRLKIKDELIDMDSSLYPNTLNTGTSPSDHTNVGCKNAHQSINDGKLLLAQVTNRGFENDVATSSCKSDIIEYPVHPVECNDILGYPIQATERIMVYPAEVAYTATEQVLLEYTDTSDAIILENFNTNPNEIHESKTKINEKKAKQQKRVTIREDNNLEITKLERLSIDGDINREKIFKETASGMDSATEPDKDTDEVSQQIPQKAKANANAKDDDTALRESAIFQAMGNGWNEYQQKYNWSPLEEQGKWSNVPSTNNVLTVQTAVECCPSSDTSKEIERIVEKHLEKIRKCIETIQSDSQNILILSIELSSLKETMNNLSCTVNQITSKLSDSMDNTRNEFPICIKEYLDQKLQCVFKKIDESRCSILRVVEENIQKITKASVRQSQPAVNASRRNSATKSVDVLELQLIDKANENYEILSQEQAIQADLLKKIQQTLIDLQKHKLDKEEIDDLLSEKADYTLLYRKASVERMDANRRELEKRIAEISASIGLIESCLRMEIAALRDAINAQNAEELIRQIKAKLDKEINAIKDQLRKLSDISKPELEASGGRVDYVRDMECLSCNQECVMRKSEISIPKLKDAHSTPSNRPFITYELGCMRKPSQLGALCKCREGPPGEKKMCPCGRHAGGPHTIITAEDRVKRLRK